MFDRINRLEDAIQKFHMSQAVYYGHFQGEIMTVSTNNLPTGRIGEKELRMNAGLDSILAHLIYLRKHDKSRFK